MVRGQGDDLRKLVEEAAEQLPNIMVPGQGDDLRRLRKLAEEGAHQVPSTTVRGQAANTRVTVDLGSAALYRSVKVLAAYQGRPLREIVVEALKDWLEKQEELEDLQDFVAAAGELGRPLGEIMAELGE